MTGRGEEEMEQRPGSGLATWNAGTFHLVRKSRETNDSSCWVPCRRLLELLVSLYHSLLQARLISVSKRAEVIELVLERVRE